jgi:hypothetical protein
MTNILTKDNVIFTLNFVLPAIFASIFIGLFFFLYGKNIERQVVVNNVNYLLTDISDEVKLLPKISIDKLKQSINNTILPDMTTQDNNVKVSNDKLLDQVKYISLILLALTFVIVYYLSTIVDITSDELYGIIIKAVILLVCIGVVEYLFLGMIVSNYLSVNPNIAKQHIVNKFRGLQTTKTVPGKFSTSLLGSPTKLENVPIQDDISTVQNYILLNQGLIPE